MKRNAQQLFQGDCIDFLKRLERSSVDVFYFDPPFFTQKAHSLTTRCGTAKYSFRDLWRSEDEYGDFLLVRLREAYRCLKQTGSLFFHCDENAVHIARLILDNIFGAVNFQAEIIWSFRRWSNAKKGLMPSHQTILFYARSSDFKFNTITTPYSESTNVDQILQKRIRDHRGKAIYAKDSAGKGVSSGGKRGVPLGDVWEIPFLNPKAKERVGYPTQKPVALLERIIEISSEPGDLIVDPFCGSGTTLVAAAMLNRRAIGIDTSGEALSLAHRRLSFPFKSDSRLLERGRSKYVRADLETLNCLQGIPYHPVHRNNGIDAILADEWNDKPVCVRIQRAHESICEAALALQKAGRRKLGAKLILVAIEPVGRFELQTMPTDVIVVQSAAASIRDAILQAGGVTRSA